MNRATNINCDSDNHHQQKNLNHGYPPDLSEDATQLVLKQAELSTEAGAE